MMSHPYFNIWVYNKLLNLCAVFCSMRHRQLSICCHFVCISAQICPTNPLTVNIMNLTRTLSKQMYNLVNSSEALFLQKSDGDATTLSRIICVQWIRLKYPHHFSPSSPIPSCYSLNKTNRQLFALPCFLVDFPSSALVASLTTVQLYIFCFFFLLWLQRAETTREIYGPCVSFVERFLMFLRWHHVPDRKNKRPHEAAQVAAPYLLCSWSSSSPSLCCRVSGFDCPNAILVLWIKNCEGTSTSETVFQLCHPTRRLWREWGKERGALVSSQRQSPQPQLFTNFYWRCWPLLKCLSRW